MSEFTSTIDLGEIGEQEVSVKFDFFPEEKMTRDDPGCSAEVEITSVIWRGIDIQADCCKELIEQLEQEAFEHMASVRRQSDEDRAERLHDLREAA